jgi:hypothetical protein
MCIRSWVGVANNWYQVRSILALPHHRFATRFKFGRRAAIMEELSTDAKSMYSLIHNEIDGLLDKKLSRFNPSTPSSKPQICRLGRKSKNSAMSSASPRLIFWWQAMGFPGGVDTSSSCRGSFLSGGCGS